MAQKPKREDQINLVSFRTTLEEKYLAYALSTITARQRLIEAGAHHTFDKMGDLPHLLTASRSQLHFTFPSVDPVTRGP